MNECTLCKKQVWYNLTKKMCKACYARDYYRTHREARIRAVMKHQKEKNYISPWRKSDKYKEHAAKWIKEYYKRNPEKYLVLLEQTKIRRKQQKEQQLL